jgi:hypothetical protein
MYGSVDSLLEKRCNFWMVIWELFQLKWHLLKSLFSEKNGALNALITNYPAFSGALKECFESKQVGLLSLNSTKFKRF